MRIVSLNSFRGGVFCLILIFHSIYVVCQDIETEKLNLIIKHTTDKIMLDSTSSTDFELRGLAYLKLGKFKKAINDFSSAIKLMDDNRSDLFIFRGDAWYELKEYQAAINDYKSAINSHLLNPQYYISLGVAQETIGLFDNALDSYTKAIEISDEAILAYKNRAILYSDHFKEYQLSIHDWTKLIEISPESGNYNDRGLEFLNSGNYEKAIEDFNAALALNPINELYILNRGFAYGKMKLYEESQLDFQMALSLNKENAKIYKYRGLIYLDQEDIVKACEDFRAAEKLGLNDLNFIPEVCK